MRQITKKKMVRILSIIILLLASYIYQEYFLQQKDHDISTISTGNTSLQVHYIDVGQGDAILIKSKDHSMLIDAGENSYGDIVVNYLKKQNISALEYVVGTHPHSDHIGGLDTVLQSFDVNHVIMPEVVHSTKTYEDVLDAVDAKGLSITTPVPGDIYSLGEAQFEIIAPISSSYNNLNEYSVVIRLVNGQNSFLFTGDVEDISETEMLENNSNLRADVLKLAHHGSAYSSPKEFLDEVSPSIAIISAGIDNQYGHPHVEIMQAMLDRTIEVYRTDKQGSIILYSDGTTISANVKKYQVIESDLKRKR